MRYILILLIGLIAGALLTYYIFVRAPHAKQLQLGASVQAPEANGDPPGTVVLTLDEKFFETLLGTVFRDLGTPSFKLAAADKHAPHGSAEAAGGVRFITVQEGGCQNQVLVSQEGSGVHTGVRLANGQIVAPLAFSGSYNVPLIGCKEFRGSAQSNIQLSFKQEEQTLYGQINVEGVNLEGISPIVSPFITGFVQNAINQRVNPLVLMRGSQLSLVIPVQASSGTLKGQAKDIRSEIKDGALRLHITYDFSGARGSQLPPPQS
jgi:hypothetical protein